MSNQLERLIRAEVAIHGKLWLAPVAALLMIPLKPSVWARSKLISFREWRRLC